ncbi:Putative antitoxin YwqK [Kordia antarctica]|uniref:Antitoxin YwqK n=1 Tax=Kordia antarctica TaxID=1218801 RepID=A0A7L4ZGN1_9FLAO|nr:tetratricopeptide repeat protein [Kordia antarctica]QHI35873.1 Putative antitoxin YwqK [Kordia antarctica]
MKNILYFCLLLAPILSFSQEKIPLIDVEKIIDQVREKEQSGETQQALDLLNKIHKNDSTYCSILTSKAYYLINLEKYDEVIELMDEAKTYSCGDVRVFFYVNQGVAYASKENYAKALEVYNEGIKHFPTYYKLWYNKGLSLEKLDRIDEAVAAYQRSITLNPLYRSPQLRLGNLCYKQGKITQALMCYNMYLLLDPDGSGSFETLQSLNNIVSSKNENESDPEIEISEDDEYFEDLDLIIDNKIALNKDYEIDHEIDIALIRQNHAMLTQLENFEGTDGFWSKKYVPFFNWIQKNEYFEDFSYTLVASIQNEKYKKQVQKKQKDIVEFLKIALEQWKLVLSKNTVVVDGEEKELHNSYQGSFVEGQGVFTNETPVGHWKFYNSYGRLTGEGNFAEDGKRIGNWKWYYETGDEKETAVYLNGELNGKNVMHYANGSMYIDGNYANGKLDGEYKFYNENGALIQKKYFKNGKLNGKYLSYFAVGKDALEYDVVYKEDLLQGTVIEYYVNGAVYRETPYTDDGKIVGIEKKYHIDGTLVVEANYKENQLDGVYTTYFANGAVNDKGQYLEGEPTGMWKTYYDDNTISDEYEYTKGKLNGSYKRFDTDGKIHYEYTYRKDEIIAYKFYDKAGKVIKEAKKKGGEFLYKSYSPDGNITSEGIYDIKGGKKGDWKFYSNNGVLTASGSYVDDKTIGEYKTFYKNGKEESVAVYKDGMLAGYYVAYHKNGKMKNQGWYKEDQAYGEWRAYYVDGTLKNSYYYHKGDLHGDQQEYSNTGKLNRIIGYKFGSLISDKFFDENEEEYQVINYLKDGVKGVLTHNFTNNLPNISTMYVNGLQHGNYTRHAFDGKKLVDGTYTNGNESGKWTWYFENGKPELIRHYFDGNKHGEELRYNEDGSIKMKAEYYRGEQQGIEVTYYKNGKVEISTPYKNNQTHGRKEFFDSLGNLQLVRFYNHGRLVGYSYLDTNGKEKPMIPITNETANIKAYYTNGKVSREMEVKNGDFVETYIAYYYSGKMESETHYMDGEFHGISKEYYSNGNLKNEKEHNYGKLHGKVKEYHENGKMKSDFNYANDELTGEAKHYNEAGKLTKTELYFNGEIYDIQTL